MTIRVGGNIIAGSSSANTVSGNGIPTSVITYKNISINGTSVSLTWKDPMDTNIDGFVLSSWASTTIVKKYGSAPESVEDGIEVVTITTRNQYADTPYVDIQDGAFSWYYRAFPCSVNGVYSLDKRNIFGTVLYGIRINETDSNPATRVEYLPWCDNAFFDPCVMDFVTDEFNWGSWKNTFIIPKPCGLLYNGTVDFYLDTENFNYKADGTANSDISNTSYGGNFMCEFPAIYTKSWKENNYIYILYSNVKLDDTFECWSCKRSDGTYNNYFYLPMFEGTVVSNVMRSIATTDKPTGSTTAENEATYASANGTGWYTTLWADEALMMMLFPLLFKSTDGQTVLGQGGSASTSGLTVNNNAALTKGMMYGQSGRGAYGITFLGLHNWYGHRWRRLNGLMNMSGNYAVKMTFSTIDGSTVEGFNRIGNGYISTGITPPTASESYINRYRPLGTNGSFGLVPQATTGSSSTFYCDGMWTNNGQLDQLILGADVAHGLLAGSFAFNVNGAPSDSSWNRGASLSFRLL